MSRILIIVGAHTFYAGCLQFSICWNDSMQWNCFLWVVVIIILCSSSATETYQHPAIIVIVILGIMAVVDFRFHTEYPGWRAIGIDITGIE